MRLAAEIEHRVGALVDKLPPMPETVERLLDERRRPSAEELPALVRRDPGLCIDLLKLANRAVGSGDRVETIEDALQLVGTEAFAQYSGVSFANAVIQRDFAALRHLPQYFAHSQEISLTCRALAEVVGQPAHDRDMYGVAGLIHDIGRLVMLIATDDLGARLVGTSAERMLAVVRDEEGMAGLNHCDIGQQICSQWNFSPILREGVQRHHTPAMKGDVSRPGSFIFLAHFVGLSDFTGQILSSLIHKEIFDVLGITPADMDEARRLYRERVASTNEALSVSPASSSRTML